MRLFHHFLLLGKIVDDLDLDRIKGITMDYEGQKLAELIFYWVILTFGSVGWIIGYFQEDFTIVFQAWLAGVVLSVVVSEVCALLGDASM